MAQLDTDLSMALSLTETELDESQTLRVGYDPSAKTWEIIVRYHGDLARVAEQLGAPVRSMLLFISLKSNISKSLKVLFLI